MAETKRGPGRPKKATAATPVDLRDIDDDEDDAPGKVRALADPVRLGRAAFLRARLRLLVKDQSAARSSRSWVAVRQLGQDIDTSHKELRELEQAASTTQQTPTEILAELLALIRDTSQGFPDDAVEAIYVASCERMGISVLREVG